ncbi:ABC transporter ATP-binding protein [Devosia sp. PTR5]|uniref:ABC transporter ATP-binding protein n=1 Tax=Devosia oryzisoli TaxID=2774138 RepID=A0A927FTZ2_9HYPH|nr:ABC transporter ATP-binding protein [Devosia oryzisoli]MBD8065966.1 ABC transporter ATP-binding protein [Devosia oryzisoli]
MSEANLLEIQQVSKRYVLSGGRPFGKPPTLQAVSDIDLAIRVGHSVGLVGESGCGKSTLAKIAAGFVPPSMGTVLIRGTPQRDARGHVRRGRRKIQMVFQDPLAALDARLSVSAQIDEALVLASGSRGDVAERRNALLGQVGLNPELATRLPHELSGGQRQRVVIGRALAADPELLVCDEPLAALDVSVQAQILALLNQLQQSMGLTLLFISHQLSTVRYLCDEVVVMYAGRIVERGTTAQVYQAPRHPYTEMLLSTALDPRQKHVRTGSVVGEAPNPIALPSGCPFHPRCPRAQLDLCARVRPELQVVEGGQLAACHFA